MTYDDYAEALELVELVQKRACLLLEARGESYPGGGEFPLQDVRGGVLHLAWYEKGSDWGEESASVPLAELLLSNEEFLELLETEHTKRKEARAKYAAAERRATEQRERALFEQLKRKFEPGGSER